MKNAQFYLLIGICLGFLLVLNAVGHAQQVPDDVYWAAEDGLAGFIKQIPWESMKLYGFENNDHIKNLKLGRPFKLFSISPDALLDYSTNDSIDYLIQETQMWYFPVMLKGKEKAILVIDIVDNKWKAVLFGHATLAKELQKMRKQWPREKGYNPKLIAVFQAKEMFFHIPEKDSQNLTSLKQKNRVAAIKADGKNYSKLEMLSNAVPRLTLLVTKNLENGF
jgi:hypothetical protein